MRTLGWLFSDETSAAHPDAILDLSEFAHPIVAGTVAAALRAADPTTVPGAVLLPPDPGGAAWAAIDAAPRIVAIDRIDTPAVAATVGERLAGESIDVVARLRTGRGLYYAEAIMHALQDRLGARLRGLWYAPADLLVDYRDDPGALYVVDLEEPRLAAPSWTRSRCLTIARACGVELWGQLDLTFAEPPANAELDAAVALAAANGFDVVIARHAPATLWKGLA